VSNISTPWSGQSEPSTLWSRQSEPSTNWQQQNLQPAGGLLLLQDGVSFFLQQDSLSMINFE
jgi:hypothetical protein